mmetsp:Transcript_11929/g.20127  ORF Transcript_11929/g.20127 Transcript_11929/m.20127 type:complete len:193 (+) Transcript_11929:99-677(+)|eukprot:CAMPEP_0119344632 /NCGR_PEP_ID=MMETSP1333-20130426/107069_1 /TAXON_ID=418940 /ORGANISM="Scyphosphaera apsteinii, Strain RCC1455" /LENGTH=192 /DNA_ID=CAMNT_0007357073 /DNA_START=97 /DNA_END=675 /DNA_ORIENTATION=+
MSFITLMVPLDAAPGSNLQFTDPATNQTFTVGVPQGAQPGSTFQVQLATQQRRSDSDVAIALAAAAGKMAFKATIATSKATFAAAKYAHSKGWDAKVAKAGVNVAKIAGGALLAGGKMLVNEATKGSSAAAPAAAPLPPPAPNGPGLFWVMVPPGIAPGQQICVLAPTGQQVMVVIPEGAVPGTQFQCQLAS